MTDEELILDHPYQGDGQGCTYVHRKRVPAGQDVVCTLPPGKHADPRGNPTPHLVVQFPHEYRAPETGGDHCSFSALAPRTAELGERRVVVCGYPEREHVARRSKVGALPVRMADVAQYQRPPMPDAARRGITVTLIDAPVDPLGTMAVIGGIYTGKVRRSKSEVTDEDRRSMLDDMMATVLNGPLESIQFTFLVEGVDRAITHQMVRNRFAFYAQESLRFAVAEDWAQEIPLPPSLAGLPDDSPAVGVWLRALNQAEDNYAALIGVGMPAEEARGVLPHAITTRLYWTVNLRSLVMEAGKRTCTQAQFPWRQLFAGVAKAFRHRADQPGAYNVPEAFLEMGDGWQYQAFANLLRPVCYQEGKCGFMASFDRGCKIRGRVDAFAEKGVPSSKWDKNWFNLATGESINAIQPHEWAADPGAARMADGTVSGEQGH